jgi:hypothetical protein
LFELLAIDQQGPPSMADLCQPVGGLPVKTAN